MELDVEITVWQEIEDIFYFAHSIDKAELVQIKNATDNPVRNYELEVLMIYPIGLLVLASLLPYLLPKVIASLQPHVMPYKFPVLPTH
jgi:hypothetical protein